jgi:hypothetical protein
VHKQDMPLVENLRAMHEQIRPVGGGMDGGGVASGRVDRWAEHCLAKAVSGCHVLSTATG